MAPQIEMLVLVGQQHFPRSTLVEAEASGTGAPGSGPSELSILQGKQTAAVVYPEVSEVPSESQPREASAAAARASKKTIVLPVELVVELVVVVGGVVRHGVGCCHPDRQSQSGQVGHPDSEEVSR